MFLSGELQWRGISTSIILFTRLVLTHYVDTNISFIRLIVTHPSSTKVFGLGCGFIYHLSTSSFTRISLNVTYVNTSLSSFFNFLNEAYRSSRDCTSCSISESAWSTLWSVIVSSFYPGTIVGFLVTPLMIARIGVKRTQAVTCFSAIIGCMIHLLAELAVYQGEMVVGAILSIGRLLIGIQAGASLCLLPLYIIEISPLEHRPFLSTFQQVSQALGTLLGLLIGSEEILHLGSSRFTYLQFFAVFPSILLEGILALTPKTPLELKRKHAKTTELIESMFFYYGSTSTLNEIQEECSAKRKSLTQKLEKRPLRKSLKGFLVGVAASASYAFTADDLIDTFSAKMLTKADKYVNPLQSATSSASVVISVYLGVILLITSIFGIFLVDRFGRRHLLLFGLFGSSAAMCLPAFFPEQKLLVSLGFTLTKAFIGLGAGAPPWFLTSELVDFSHVSLLQSLSTGVLLISTMLVTFSYLQLELVIGSYSVLVLSSGPSLFLAIILAFFLPETKNKTNDEVLALLSARCFSGLGDSRHQHSVGYGALKENNRSGSNRSSTPTKPTSIFE